MYHTRISTKMSTIEWMKEGRNERTNKQINQSINQSITEALVRQCLEINQSLTEICCRFVVQNAVQQVEVMEFRFDKLVWILEPHSLKKIPDHHQSITKSSQPFLKKSQRSPSITFGAIQPKKICQRAHTPSHRPPNSTDGTGEIYRDKSRLPEITQTAISDNIASNLFPFISSPISCTY